MSVPVGGAGTEPVHQTRTQSNLRRRLVAAFLSAFVPGLGQMQLRQQRKGFVLLLAFGVILFGIWPLRLPRYFELLLLTVVFWICLDFYAVAAALLYKEPPDSASPSKGWLLLAAVLTFAAFNAEFKPVFIAAGFRAFRFNSSAMEPTLFIGDQFVSDMRYYRTRPISRDDLVQVARKGNVIVKRVIAVGGDTISSKDGRIIVNGKMLEEDFIRHSRHAGSGDYMDNFGPTTIPAGKYFVMGDNRDVSLDSRTPEFGLVDGSAIVGRPLYIYLSPLRSQTGKNLQ